MKESRAKINSVIANERKRMLGELRHKDKKALIELPSIQSSEIEVFDKIVKFTTFIEKQADDMVLVLVRSDEMICMGIVSAGTTEGFWKLSNGTTKAATEHDVLEYFE